MTTALARLEDTPQRVAEPCWWRVAEVSAHVTEVWVQRPNGRWDYRMEDADGRTIQTAVAERRPFKTIDGVF